AATADAAPSEPAAQTAAAEAAPATPPQQPTTTESAPATAATQAEPAAPSTQPSTSASATETATTQTAPATPAAQPAPAEAAPAAGQSAAPTETQVATAPAIHIWLSSQKSRDQAERGWKELQTAYPDLLGKLELTVREVDLGAAKGVWYRVYAGPLASKQDAKDLCAKIKAQP